MGLTWHKCETAKGVEYSTGTEERYVIYPDTVNIGLFCLFLAGSQLTLGSIKMCKDFATQREKQKQED